MVRLKSPPGRRDREQDGDGNGFLGEQNYIQALGADSMEGEWSIVSLALFYCHQIVMTEVLPRDLAVQMMMMGCPELLDPPFSHFRKSNVDTAWLRQVSPSIFSHSDTLIVTKHFFFFLIHDLLSFIHSKRVGSDPRKNGDIRRSPRYRTIHSHTNGSRWVVCIHCSVFLFSLSRKCTETFTVRVSPTRPEEWKQDSTESTYKNASPHI